MGPQLSFTPMYMCTCFLQWVDMNLEEKQCGWTPPKIKQTCQVVSRTSRHCTSNATVSCSYFDRMLLIHGLQGSMKAACRKGMPKKKRNCCGCCSLTCLMVLQIQKPFSQESSLVRQGQDPKVVYEFPVSLRSKLREVLVLN